MIAERPADRGALHRAERRQLLGLLRPLPEEALRTVVPATPAWSVQEVVATVTAERLPLLRAFGGRVGDDDVRAFGWSGAVDAVLPFVDAHR